MRVAPVLWRLGQSEARARTTVRRGCSAATAAIALWGRHARSIFRIKLLVGRAVWWPVPCNVPVVIPATRDSHYIVATITTVRSRRLTNRS